MFKTSAKKMRFLFKRCLEFEKQHGTPARVESERESYRVFVESRTAETDWVLVICLYDLCNCVTFIGVSVPSLLEVALLQLHVYFGQLPIHTHNHTREPQLLQDKLMNILLNFVMSCK